jgi:hypothetical protein
VDLRYGSYNINNNPDESDGMKLTDCPGSDRHMAYLSELIEWHMLDPVDEAEKNRNERVCGYYQGNRNPFVDFPQLVEFMYGHPQSRPYSCSNDDDDNNDDDDGSEYPSTFAPASSLLQQQYSAPSRNFRLSGVWFLTVIAATFSFLRLS